MSFQKSILDIIKKRKSIRTYDTLPISEKDYQRIYAYLNAEDNLTDPLGRKAKVKLVSVNKETTDKGIKVGTYGFIKNPKAYIVGIMENNQDALVAFGYIFEKLILYLTELNIGTCWLGGTFTRNSFEEEIHLSENEIIPCITPIGYAKDKQRLFDKTLRFMIKADNRKTWDELFYYGNFQRKLKEKDADKFVIPMEMVRLGPSASNKQPWRMILSEDKHRCHFYLERTPNYSGNKMGFEMQRIDIGIGMCHFDLSCRALKIEGNWKIEDPKIPLPNEYTEYIISWQSK